jgi:hypothetical protein
MTPPTRLLLLSLILISVTPLLAQDGYPATAIARQDAAAYLKPLNERGVVSLKTIAGDFATNQVAAIGKYTDHMITVVGRIAHLSQGHGENVALVVKLQDAAASLPAVKGVFLPSNFSENSAIQISPDGSSASLIKRDAKGKVLSQNTFLTVDQTVAIKGNYKNIDAGDIILNDCKLIPKERLHELRNELEKKGN